jgi:tetratricopeptide (TPR) repeat protein
MSNRAACTAMLGWIAVVAILPACGPVGARAEAVPPLAWRDDPEPEHLVPRHGQQPLLLYFTADWCGPCRLLEREVFNDPAGQAELRHYELVRLDLDSPQGRALADSFRIATVPSFVMLAAGGGEIERVCGYRSRRLLLRDLARFRRGEGTRDDLQRRLLATPDDPALLAELGLRHHARQELSEAAAMLAAGLAESAQLPDTLAAAAARGLADVRRRQGEPAVAAATLEDLLARWPDHPYPRVTWQLLAACRREYGDAVAALAALRAAAAIPPLRAEALMEYARAAAELGSDLSEAEAAARQAVAMTGREDPEALAILAEVLRRCRAYPEAMLWIKRAVAAAPLEPRWQRQRQAILEAAINGD